MVKLEYRCLARFIVEAETPLMPGSGNSNVGTDHLVIRDVNDLPYIPGTALAGIFRSSWESEIKDKAIVNDIFGYQLKESGYGSKIIFSDAKIVSKDKVVLDGISQTPDIMHDYYKILPVRQHVLIKANGAAGKGGKFDEEIVFRGTRFCFEIELKAASENEKDIFLEILSNLKKSSFRIGGSSRKGFGKLLVVESKIKVLNLSKKDDLELYLNKTSSLNDPFWKKSDSFWENCTLTQGADDFETIRFSVKAKDFLLLSSGFGDEKADTTPMKENVLIWKEWQPELKSFFVIPATSIKGAIAHRTVFHYFDREKIYLEDLYDQSESVLQEEPLCKTELFGSVKDKASPGNVLFSDIYISREDTSTEIQPHVVIDAFTGGAAKGKLFQEELLKINVEIPVTIEIARKNYSPNVKEAFLDSVDDLKKGLLALGAATNRGHGTFTFKNQ